MLHRSDSDLSSTNLYGKETRPSVLKCMIITDKQARKPYYVLTWEKKIRSKVVDSVIKSDGYLTQSFPHSVRTVLRYVTVTSDKVRTVK